MVRDGWRASSAAGTLAAVLWLAGCAGTPQVQQAAAPAPAPAQPTLQEWMQQAQSAQSSGQRERARQAWRSAAKAYPTQKSPWQSLAQDYFDAADYGNAILSAQEVLQRDGDDALAHSVLALSGLRLSTVSLMALRERESYSVGSRDEALGLTRAMREALGDSTSTPVRAEAPTRAAAQAPQAVAKPASQAPQARAATAVVAPAAAPVATPAVNTVTAVPRGNGNGNGRPSAGAVVPVAAVPAATPAPAAAPAARPPAPNPAPRAAAAAPTPKPASADPFKLLN